MVSIKFDLIRDFRQIAASRHPAIGTWKRREKRKPAHSDGESKCVVWTTPLLNEQAPPFFVLVVRVIRPATGAGLERRFVDAADKRTEFCEYDRRHNRRRHRMAALCSWNICFSRFIQGLSLVRLWLRIMGKDHNGNLFFLDWTETQMKHTVTVPCQVRSAGI